ncbi:MAG: hypothetical protein AMXMBFR84_08490 [Candidatus Hydrogenedentota bacterium]
MAASSITSTSGAQETPKLAVDGGAKAITGAVPKSPRFGDPERERLSEMLGQDALFYWKGPQTTLMMDRFREFCPLEHVMTCGSGTAALHIAVGAAGIVPGDEVITAPITDIGTVIGVIYQMAVPVFADLVPDTYNLDPADVERRITPKTKAIIAVHLAGNPCDMEALRAIADKHNLVLIEDCAQAWAAKYRGKPIGTLGDIACFSLQNSKHITCGDGGVAASSHPVYGPKLQQYGDKGFNCTTSKFESFSTNYRMSEPQAAVVAGQLTRLEDIVARRSHAGNRLTEGIKDIPGITPHGVHPEDRCSYWFYMFRMNPAAFTCDRAQFVKALSAEGLPCAAGYIPTTMHKSPVFLEHGFFNGHWPAKELGLTTMDFNTHETPEAEAILKTGIRVMVTEAMNDAYIDQCTDAIRKVATHYKA